MQSFSVCAETFIAPAHLSRNVSAQEINCGLNLKHSNVDMKLKSPIQEYGLHCWLPFIYLFVVEETVDVLRP